MSLTSRLAPIAAQPGASDSTWMNTFVRGYDRVARSAGLEPLRNMETIPSRREIRVWFGGGIGYPQSLYRFEATDDGVEGELILHWPAEGWESNPGETFHDLILHSRSGSCDQFAVVEDTGTCRALFDAPPDWESALYNAEIAGLWMLPDPSTLPQDEDELLLCLDCTSMTVELHDGSTYRAYQYSSGDLDLPHPEAEHARDVWRAITGIRRGQRSSDVHRAYRGVTAGTFGSAFHPCEADETWEFRGHLDHMARFAGIRLPEAGEEGYLLEVVGTPSPEWQARRWRSEHPRVFQAASLVSVEPTDAIECE